MGQAIIIQARMSSRRFPGKMMMELAGMPLVEYMYRRCSQSKIGQVVVATSVDKSDDTLADFCMIKGIPVHRGPLDDVLQRFIDAANSVGATQVVRVSGDTPLVDIKLFERMIDTLAAGNKDYVACSRDHCFAGFYAEAVSVEALVKAHGLTREKEDLEHVTKYILEHQGNFKVQFMDGAPRLSAGHDPKFTVDLPGDLVVVNELVRKLPEPLRFTSDDVIKVI